MICRNCLLFVQINTVSYTKKTALSQVEQSFNKGGDLPIPEDSSSRCLTGTTWHKKSMLFYQNTEETASQQLFLYPGTVQAGIEPAVVISNSTNTCNPMDSEDLNLLVALHKRGERFTICFTTIQ